MYGQFWIGQAINISWPLHRFGFTITFYFPRQWCLAILLFKQGVPDEHRQ